MNPLVSAVGLLAATVGITVSAPQVLRLVRSPHADGMSHASAVLGLLATSTWLTYGLLIVDTAQILANVSGLTGAIAIYVLVVRRGRFPWRPGLAALACWALAAAAVDLLWNSEAVGILATCITLVARVPQVRTVFRSTSLAALSRTSVILGTASSSLWLVYGVLTAELPVWSSSSAVLVMSTLILARQAQVSRRVAAAHEATEHPVLARASIPAPRRSVEDALSATAGLSAG